MNNIWLQLAMGKQSYLQKWVSDSNPQTRLLHWLWGCPLIHYKETEGTGDESEDILVYSTALKGSFHVIGSSPSLLSSILASSDPLRKQTGNVKCLCTNRHKITMKQTGNVKCLCPNRHKITMSHLKMHDSMISSDRIFTLLRSQSHAFQWCKKKCYC